MIEGWWYSFGIAGFWLSIGALVWILWRDRERRRRDREEKERRLEELIGPAPDKKEGTTVKDLERQFGKKG